MAGIYSADLWCDTCIEDIKNNVFAGRFDHERSLTREEWEVAHGFDDETAYDSDEYPKYCSDDAESDCPQHCAAGADCLDYSETSNGEKYGYFFENNLTGDGDENVKETVNEDLRDGRMDSPAVELWMPYYSYIDYHGRCECGTYADLDDNDECDNCNNNPEDGDYTITPCGSLGGMSAVGVIGGKFIGEFHSDDEAIMAIRRIMSDESFWPNIWIVSDHGNWSLHTD